MIPSRLAIAIVIAGGIAALAAPRFLEEPLTLQPRPDIEALAPVNDSGDTTRTDLSDGERKTISIFKRASPSVVFITRLNQGRLSLTPNSIPTGTGSGFVWDKNGHIVTNFHVISGASAARVTLADHSTWNATLVGSSAANDIAVLKITAPASKLKPLPTGVSNNLLVGQHVFAIGNPFGLDHTLSTGVISGVGREIRSASGHPISGVVQTDAAINPGNSGGPLLDSKGRLIGINTAIVSPSGASAGIGFAVPADTVNATVPQLIKHGKVVRPGLGIEISEASVVNLSGVLVMNVQPGLGAATAGLRGTSRDRSGALVLGDVIVGVGNNKVTTSGDLLKALSKRNVGDVVKLTVERDGKKRKVSVKLSALSG